MRLAKGWAETGQGERVAIPEVLVAQPSFCLGRTEVKRAEMKQPVTPAEAPLPAEVGFKEALTFCKARGMRLPTQAEWVFAAVGATDFLFPWGDDFPPDGVCWLRGPTPEPCPVGTRPRDVTPDGVLDLAGNVVEWVYAPTAGDEAWWFPYELVGYAHNSDCFGVVFTDSLRRTVGGSNVADQERGGFRCAANGRPRSAIKSAP